MHEPQLNSADALVIGAGPYGIALAYDLHVHGVDAVVVGHPFSLWRNHTLSATRLRSDVNTSQVFSRDGRFSLLRFLADTYPADVARRIQRGRIPVEVFRAYTQWIRANLPFSPIEQKVIDLRIDGRSQFVARLDDGRQIESTNVVIASGIESHQVLPECLARLPARLVMHGWRVREFEHLHGRRLLVVGGGQSAAEVLVHLSATNDMTWVHRSRLIFFAEPISLPRPIFALALHLSNRYYFLPAALRRKLGALFVASTITPDLKPALMTDKIRRAEADAAELELEERDGEIYSAVLDQSFDLVIACTGYKYQLSSLGFLEPELAQQIAAVPGGTPRLDYNFATSVPGLFMVGGIAEPVHGPAQRFMMGGRHATLRVSQAIRNRLAARRAPTRGAPTE
jgi:lysine/ornithine N-monooxygenase